MHDNAPVHKCRIALAALHETGFEVLNHPPYSLDLAPAIFISSQKLPNTGPVVACSGPILVLH